ncbi:MAG: AmmeMemoRadiSam system protein B [Planctomycetes bacterium]|nr:AmmeMemoRadiSam system protein B [Planctomycetota bacterium]
MSSPGRDHAESAPALRAFELRPAEFEGRRGLVLIDPLGLIDGQVFVPEALVPILARLDGTRTLASIEAELRAAGAVLRDGFLADLVVQLDESLLLHGELFESTAESTAAQFLAEGVREASHAGSHGYPAGAGACARALDELLGELSAPTGRAPRGLVAPHIDFGRGASGYRAAYRALAAHELPELVVVFGTGHGGPLAPLTGLPLDWRTPLGTLRTERAFVDAVHARLGAPAPADLLLHRKEHSLEFQMLCLAALSLARTGRPDAIPVAGFLCGSLPSGDGDLDRETWIAGLLDALRGAAAKRRVTFLAGADLAHVGPTFGDDAPLGDDAVHALARRDDARLAMLRAGEPGHFHAAVMRGANPDRVCSATAIYLAARLAGGAAEILHYGQALAEDRTQCVTFCSAILRGEP